MNKQAIEHQHESKYCFYLDDKRCVIRVRTAKNDTIEKIEVVWNEWCKFYKEKKVNKLEKAYSDELFDYYETIIASKKASYEYFIKIYDKDGEIYYLADDGLSKDYSEANTFLNEFMSKFPNEHDLPKLNKTLTGRLFYQIFPERFACSDFKKKYINMDWYEKKVDNDHFMGGDIKGIIEKIPYLKSLGVGGIWLNPIHPSDSAHKYDVNDYFKIDPMFGTTKDFKLLLKVAHENDIKIVIDLVFNHCAYHNVLFQDVVKNGKKSKYYNWFFVDGDKPNYKNRNYLTFADVANMPKLNTSNPEVLDYFTKVVLYWADMGVDGFRLDVAFEVSYYFWRSIKKALLEKHPDCYFIAEDWMNSEKRLDNYQWDSLMNYPFRYALMRYFEDEKKDAKWISNRLNSLLMRYPDPFNHKMLNLLDSHDTPRWYNTVKFDKDFYFMSYALLMFYPGVPEIYYGNEILMEGEQDPFNRRGMEWNSKVFGGEDNTFFKQILKLRELEPVKYGEVRAYEKDGIAFISRFIGKEEYVLAFYKGNKPVDLKVKNLILQRNYDGNKITKTGFVVYKK